MEDTEADALKTLEQGIRAGGTNLSRKQLGLLNDSTLLRHLCDRGHLVSAGKGKFTVTENGLKFWQERCAPICYEEVRKEAIHNFLKLVQQKSGRKLSARELRSFLPHWLDEVQRLGLCAGAGPGCYRLLPEGEEFLFSQLPVAEQLEIKRSQYQKKIDAVREMRAELTGQLTALHNEVVREFYRLEQEEFQVQEIKSELEGHIALCDRAYEDSVRAVADAISFANAARSFREQVRKEGEEAIAQVDGKCRDIGERLRSLEAMVLKKLGDIEQRLTEVDLENLLPLKTGHVPPAPMEGGGAADADLGGIKLEGMDDEEIFYVAGEIHRQYCHAHPEVGGSMPIPELFEGLKKQRTVVELKVLHDFLIQWMHQGRVSLWVCSTPGLEPRADMGIPSERGLLFYVRMR